MWNASSGVVLLRLMLIALLTFIFPTLDCAHVTGRPYDSFCRVGWSLARVLQFGRCL